MARRIELPNLFEECLELMNTPKSATLAILGMGDEFSGPMIRKELLDLTGKEEILPNGAAFTKYGLDLEQKGFAKRKIAITNGREASYFSLNKEGKEIGLGIAGIVLSWESDNQLSLSKILGGNYTHGSAPSTITRTKMLMDLDINGTLRYNELQKRNSLGNTAMVKSTKFLKDIGFIEGSNFVKITPIGKRFLNQVIYPGLATIYSDEDRLQLNKEALELIKHLGPEVFTRAFITHTNTSGKINNSPNRYEREKAIIDYLRKHPNISAVELKDGINAEGQNIKTIYSYLPRLMHEGKIKRENGHYFISGSE